MVSVLLVCVINFYFDIWRKRPICSASVVTSPHSSLSFHPFKARQLANSDLTHHIINTLKRGVVLQLFIYPSGKQRLDELMN